MRYWEVTSDILFLQKRDRIVDIESDWVHLSQDENGIAMNSYFVEYPEMVVGSMEMVSGPYGMESTCVPDDSIPFEEQLQKSLSFIEGSYEEIELEELNEELTAEVISAVPEVKNFSYALIDDRSSLAPECRRNSDRITAAFFYAQKPLKSIFHPFGV